MAYCNHTFAHDIVASHCDAHVNDHAIDMVALHCDSWEAARFTFPFLVHNKVFVLQLKPSR
jgi:hypothetical protein